MSYANQNTSIRSREIDPSFLNLTPSAALNRQKRFETTSVQVEGNESLCIKTPSHCPYAYLQALLASSSKKKPEIFSRQNLKAENNLSHTTVACLLGARQNIPR
jgi:hypothetical protein